MRIRKLSALLLSLAMLLGLLAGCGGDDEAEITAEDFYGCWEYANQDVWLYIQGGGTYEWISEYSSLSAGYYMDGVELYLDGLGLTVSLDGEGNLIDSDGEVLFASELPDFYYNYGWDDEEDDDWDDEEDDDWDDEEDDDWDDEDYSPTVTAEDFYGCWEYTDTYTWVTVRMPADYDGLVFCASPSPYTYEELTAHLHEGEGYVIGMTLEERTGIDEDNALFCRILW